MPQWWKSFWAKGNNRILALKELGFSLAQIRRMLNEELTAGQLRGMLKMKHAEAEQQAREVHERLARLEARLKQIELENAMPNHEVVLKKIQPMAEDPNCLICRDLKQVAELTRQPDEDVIRTVGLPNGTWMRRIEPPPGTSPAFAPRGQPLFFVRSGQPPPDPQALAAGPDDQMITFPFVEAHTLPGVETAAAVIHEGERDTIVLAYRALADWVANNGYRVAGHFQENVLRESGAPMIELAIPVQKI